MSIGRELILLLPPPTYVGIRRRGGQGVMQRQGFARKVVPLAGRCCSLFGVFLVVAAVIAGNLVYQDSQSDAPH